MAFLIENNQPAAGSIRWSSLNMEYKGINYAIANGYTNYIYVYWTPSSPTTLVVSNTFPTLGPDDCLIFLNKLGTALTVPTSTIMTGDLIVPGSIMAVSLAASTITGDKIAGGTITGANLVAGTISATQIAANAIGATAISAGVITGDKLVADTITAREIGVGVITATEIKAGTITADKLVAGTITAASGVIGSIDATTITTGYLKADRIQGGILKLGGSVVETRGNLFVYDILDKLLLSIDEDGLVAYNGKIKVQDTYINPGDPWGGSGTYDKIARINAGDINLTYGNAYGVYTANLDWSDGLTLSAAGGMNIPNYYFKIGWTGDGLPVGITFDAGLNFLNHSTGSLIAAISMFGIILPSSKCLYLNSTSSDRRIGGNGDTIEFWNHGAAAKPHFAFKNAADNKTKVSIDVGNGSIQVGDIDATGTSVFWRTSSTGGYGDAHLQLRSDGGQSVVALGFHRAGFTACSLYHNAAGGLTLINSVGTPDRFQAGAIYGSSKSNVTETEYFGEVITYADESPNHIHNDRGSAELDDNGECIIFIDPILLATISTKMCDYWVFLTEYEGTLAKIKELQPEYFTIVGTPNGKFNWKIEAERKGYERLRFNDGAIDY